MTRPIRAPIIVALLLSAAANVADANEQMRPLAVGDEWIAIAHSESMVAAPDICLVTNHISGVAFRAASGGVEFRAFNSQWSLPPDISGVIAVAVGDWTTTLDIGANTDDTIAAAMDDDIVLPMFAAMDKAAFMSVTIGKANAPGIIEGQHASNQRI